MQRRVLVFVSAAALIAVAFMVASLVSEGLRTDESVLEEAEIYSVSYRLNGGTLPEDAPASYIHGAYMPLPFPEKDGMVFSGWYTESGLTNPIGGVVPSLRGHIVLYAGWTEDTKQGTGWRMSVEGTYSNGTVSVKGTVVSGYDLVLDGITLISTENSLRYTLEGESWRDDSTKSIWSGRMTDGWRYIYTDRSGPERLTVWEDDDGSKMWLKDLTVPMRYETAVGTDGKVVQETTEVFRYRPPTTYEPIVEAEYPVTVDKIGTAEIGEDLTLAAQGDCFKGWLLNGELVSTDRTFTFNRPSPSDRITAATNLRYTVVDDGSEINGMGFEGCVVRDADGNARFNLSALRPGLYEGSIEKDGSTRTIRFLVEDDRMFSIEWEYKGTKYSISETVPFSEMYADSYDHPYLARFFQSDQNHIETFHSYNSETMKRLAVRLSDMGRGMDERTFAEFVLKFVQTIPYIEDSESRSEEEFWKFPLETLWDGGGDCEDKSILYNTLMAMNGYRTAFLMFKDHAMAAIAVSGEGESTDIEGYDFILSETTWPQYDLGQTSVGHLPEDAIYSCRIESLPVNG